MTKTPLHEFIGQLRRYDGNSNAAEFVARFRQDVRKNGYKSSWAIQNLDRILDGDAKSWYDSKWPLYSQAYLRCKDDADYDAFLNLIEGNFTAIFDHTSQVAT